MKKTDLDKLISLMNEYTYNEDELGEQESTASSDTETSGGASTSSAYPTVTKWETGLTRGPANQIGLTKWSDTVKITRGKANTLL